MVRAVHPQVVSLIFFSKLLFHNELRLIMNLYFEPFRTGYVWLKPAITCYLLRLWVWYLILGCVWNQLVIYIVEYSSYIVICTQIYVCMFDAHMRWQPWQWRKIPMWPGQGQCGHLLQQLPAVTDKLDHSGTEGTKKVSQRQGRLHNISNGGYGIANFSSGV